MKKTITFNPFDKPLYMMAKPAGASCNLCCDYCYYLEKKHLYEKSRVHRMSDELLERFIREYIEIQPVSEVLFTWHGGETLLRDISFYKKVITLQKRYGRGRIISNCLQTNGVLLNEEWCRFFRENNFLIGISIDGPEYCHDKYRKKFDGSGSFKQVMRGVELLHRHNVDFNTLSVINNYNVDYAIETYRFLKSIGSKYLQFSPIVERVTLKDSLKLQLPDSENGDISPWSVDPIKFGDFYIEIFDEWVKNDVGNIFVQLFDATLACWVGVQPGVCIFSETCGHAGIIEFNGDVYSCDHFVFPKHKLGNIYTIPLLSMMLSEEQTNFGKNKQNALPLQCKQCEYLKLCNGECPKNRIATTDTGEKGLNYLCKGYKKYFKYVSPYMEFMANELVYQRPPANVMQWVKNR